MADYRFCAHCQLAYDVDDIELEPCLLCDETICPFCSLLAFDRGAVCTRDHRDPEDPLFAMDPDEEYFDE